jgi:cytochrome c peroxidase
VADPHGLSLTSDDRWVVISASGTHELLVLRNEGLPFQDRGSTDHIDPGLLQDGGRFFRVAVGGRPMGLRIGRDDRTVFVANYLDNSIQVVDLEKRSLRKRLFLGAAIDPSLARRGEAIFYDARRSLDQWYSCHSCHYLGGSNAVTMDTMNDGTPFTFKTVLPLQQLDRTGPWTWHGWQTDLTAAMKHSLKTTMVGKEGSDEDAQALIAFLSTLELPPNPNRATDDASAESIARGEQIFRGPKGACADCHSGPRYTDGEIHDLQGGQAAVAYVGFNTPSLLGVFRKVQLMHDGKASSLEELLRGPHAPERVRGEPLTEAELSDLVRFLKTL